MKILTASDLHLEFPGNAQAAINGRIAAVPDPDSYDVVVLAGDIGSGLNGIQWADEFFPKDKQIIYVFGNHEFYNKDYTVLHAAADGYTFDRVHVLNGSSHRIDDVMFVGATLWSRAKLPGFNTPDQYFMGINDFRLIKYGPIEKFSVARMRDINAKEITQLDNILTNSEAEKKVLVTHFLPSMKCIAPIWANDPLNPYFCNDLDWLVDKADLSIFGHTHNKIDVKTDNGTRMFANPHGYIMGNRFERTDWSWEIIDV